MGWIISPIKIFLILRDGDRIWLTINICAEDVILKRMTEDINPHSGHVMINHF